MRTTVRPAAFVALVLCSLATCSPSRAGPSDYVVTPIVEEGEREIDFKAGRAKSPDGLRESKFSIGLGLGVNSWWFTEIYAIWQREPSDGRGFDAWEWENRFQLTETGKYLVDVGFLIEIERPRMRTEGYEYRWGPLLQADLSSSIQANLNLLFEKRIRATEGSAAELGYQWQLKYRWRRSLEFGLQGFGDVGPWNNWEPKSEQPHVAGPAIFGRIGLGGRQSITYNAALLMPLTHGAPRNTFRLQAEYEF